MASISESMNDRFVPEAEVNLSILNVGFGDVVYQSVTESEAAYVGRGLREADSANHSLYSTPYHEDRKYKSSLGICPFCFL